MADVLKLSDGTISVDFILAGSDYELAQNGLSVPVPDIKRVMGGDALLREGERLIERQYGNREIGIVFHIDASTHDALLEDIRVINRLLDTAKETARQGFGSKVTLAYNVTNATDQMIFDVLDGELEVGDLASEIVRRNFKLLGANLTLICQPYARLANPIDIGNELRNPGFDYNPGAVGRGKFTLDFGGAGDHGHASVTDTQPTGDPPVMSCGAWVNLQAGLAADGVIMRSGQGTMAWMLGVDSAEKAFFEWEDSGGTNRVTGATALPTTDNEADWRFVGATLFTVDGTETYGVLMLGDANGITVDGFLRDAAPDGVLLTPNTNLSFGGRTDGTLLLNARMSGAFVIVNRQILPYQLGYIYKHGLRSLYSADVMDDKYWGLKSGELVGVWPFDESATPLLSKGFTARDMTLVSLPAPAAYISKPSGWTLGADLASSSLSGLTTDQKKHGTHSLLLDEPSDSATRTLKQAGLDTSRENGKVTCVIWCRGRSAGELDFRIKLEAAEGYIIISSTLNEWKQFIVTATVAVGQDDRTFEIRTGSGATDVYIDSIMYIAGHPFGVRDGATPADVTTELLPFVGGKELIAEPDLDRKNFIEIEDIPGDVPATCRIKLLNKSGQPMAPIRLGAAAGLNPNKQENFWRASLWAPIKANDTDYASGADPVVESESAITLVDRFQASLVSLFPFPNEQVGSHKLFVGVQSAQNMYSFFRQLNESVSLNVSGDPVKDINASGTNIHVVDGGIINWPPEVALTSVRDGDLTSRARKEDVFPNPRLAVANIADVANTAIKYEYIFALPVDAGFFSLMAAVVSDLASLQDEEELVIDTIDEEAVGYGYIQERISIPSENAFNLGGKDLISAGSSDLALFGQGFTLQPRKGNVIVAQVNRHNQVNDVLFGRFVTTAQYEIRVEYMPRFLYL